ncbi:MAG: hypothetical protein LBG89_00785 [Rickettsiales bacterium]|jgi:hypothetical protein|nr:hypothetical protein [Rickettsiales bacterium]
MNIENIKSNVEYLEKLYQKLAKILPSFKITDDRILPYGLKPHTRSVSWLVEQVITQQTKYNKSKLGLDEVDFDMPDTCLHDCVIKSGDKKLFINVKIHNVGGKENKNDVTAVAKLFAQYTANPDYDIFYVCIGIRFDGLNIIFDKDYLRVFSVQFVPIYVNPTNDKIQAFYEHKPEYRSRKEFLNLLKSESRSIVLGSKK